MHKVSVVNAKGGCGKTTLSTNIAACAALREYNAVLVDHDPFESATRWLQNRSLDLPRINGVVAHSRRVQRVTQAYQMGVPKEEAFQVFDTAAGLDRDALHSIIMRSNCIVIPVLPSPIDMGVTAKFIGELLVTGKARHYGVQLGVVANRVRSQTKMYLSLQKFLKTLNIPIIAELNDFQGYNQAAEQGVGILELPKTGNWRREHQEWDKLMDWIVKSSVQPRRAQNKALHAV
ncbi:MAG: ParA family protein [Gammaproteobacteria bacterium]|nr:ParA family protein [Gammaproteobacteria bacterium]